MTKHAIFSFLSNEHVGHSADAQTTRIIFKDGQVLRTHFIMDSQEQNLMEQNKWIVTVLDKPQRVTTIDGDNIADLKVGAKPFR